MDGVVRRFEIIGEAVKKLPAVLTDAEPEIPWRAIAGFRDVLAHAYFDTAASIVWNSATEHLPALLAACRRGHCETMAMLLLFLRTQPRLCAANAFKLLALNALHKSHLKPGFCI